MSTFRLVHPAAALTACFVLAASVAGCSGQPDAATAADAEAAATAEPAEAAAADAAAAPSAPSAQEMAAAAAVASGTSEGGGLPTPTPGAATTLNPQLRDVAAGEGIVTDEEVAAQLQPPDGKWLYDDQGRRYFVTRIPKLEGYYRKDGPDKVRIKPGLIYDLVREDEESFDVKIYGLPETAAAPASAPAPPPPPPVEAVASPSVDRLRFEPFDDGLPDSGQWRNGFVVVDFDGDGHQDIVHGPPRKGDGWPYVFLGDGAGRWREFEDLRMPQVALDYGDVAVADFNRDGHLDMALAMHLRGVLVFVGDGKGGFETWSEGTGFASPEAKQGQSEFSSRALEAVDWNGDGWTDLLVLGEGPRMTGMRSRGGRNLDQTARGAVVFMNQGDGSWKRFDRGVGGNEIFGDSLAVGDFNADGRLDFATSSSAINRTDLVNLGRADGTWEPVDLGAAAPADSYMWSVAAADFDGDGRDDLAVGYQRTTTGGWFSGVDVLLSKENGWESSTAWLQEDESGVWSLATGDIDADGNVDLVATSGQGEVWILLGRGDGSFLREEMDANLHLATCRGYHAALADLDGVPGDEVILSFAGEPGSEVLFAEAQPKCPSLGELSAWKARPSDAS